MSLFHNLIQLREIIDAKVEAEEPWFGLEQEYTMLAKNTGRVYGWPENGFPAPQVGTDSQPSPSVSVADCFVPSLSAIGTLLLRNRC